MRIKTNLVRRAFGALVFAALSFGASQTLADATPMFEGDYCDPGYYPDTAACIDVCIATHGQGTQAVCMSYDGNPHHNFYPTCQCIR
jgi:hypothetical protein